MPLATRGLRALTRHHSAGICIEGQDQLYVPELDMQL